MESTPIGLTCQERNNVNVNHSQQRDPLTAIAIEMVGCKRKAEQRFALKAGGVYFSTEIAYHCTRTLHRFSFGLVGLAPSIKIYGIKAGCTLTLPACEDQFDSLRQSGSIAIIIGPFHGQVGRQVRFRTTSAKKEK